MIILAVDFGDARTGVARCDGAELMASPLCVVHETYTPKVIQRVSELAKQEGAQEIVVGLPLNMNGSRGPRADLCEEFATRLAEHSGITVKMWDERSTTVTATHFLNQTNTRGKKRKAVVDAVAATIILESYLNFRKNNTGEEK